MPTRSRTIRRAALGIVSLAAIALPFIALNTIRAVRENENDLSDWLPAAYEETRQYRTFQQFFGSEDFVVASWPGCELDAPLLADFAAELTRVKEQAAAEGGPVLISNVTTGTEIIDQLSAPPANLDLEDAVERLRGTLIGPDGRQTCALVSLSVSGRKLLGKSISTIEMAASTVGLSQDDLHLGGPPVINAAIDRASRITRPAFGTGGGDWHRGGIRHVWQRAIDQHCVHRFSVQHPGCLALVPACGMKLNAVVVTMVPLVYVAAMSGAIHFVNYFLEERASGTENPLGQAMAKAIWPLALAAITTSVGLLSLLYSELAPIRQFGVLSAAGVMIAFAAQLCLLPALLDIFGGPVVPEQAAHPSAGMSDNAITTSIWVRIARWGIRRQQVVRFALLVIFIVAGFGLSRHNLHSTHAAVWQRQPRDRKLRLV